MNKLTQIVLAADQPKKPSDDQTRRDQERNDPARRDNHDRPDDMNRRDNDGNHGKQ